MATIDGQEARASKSNYVYLLPNRSNTHFKIGVAVNPVKRAAVVAMDTDWEKARILLAKDKRHAIRIEKNLHFLFAAHRDTEAVAAGSEGYTEWFRFQAYWECLDFILNGKGMLRYLDLVDPEVFKAAPESSPTRRSGRPKEVRAPLTAEGLERGREFVFNHNQQVFLDVQRIAADKSTCLYRAGGRTRLYTEVPPHTGAHDKHSEWVVPLKSHVVEGHPDQLFEIPRNPSRSRGLFRDVLPWGTVFGGSIRTLILSSGKYKNIYWVCDWLLNPAGKHARTPFAKEIQSLIEGLPPATPGVRAWIRRMDRL